ncbi:alginate lyase family protein [Desulforhabdus sp. TSK]|uniref:heparinase II/III family protein n=1 Tax=Desulforhabdus sp. TSK TaxID=2925014 RepID=UPI001FC88EAC|nr:alginate lyase family protein [Desulforhabdus sp. TSK]
MNWISLGPKSPATTPLLSIATPHSDTAPDIRSLWEPARLQHITALLAARHQPEFSEHVSPIQNAAKTKLFDWLRENPFPFGIHYSCAMECGLRIPVLLRALLELPNLDASERSALLQALFEHGWLIRNRLSLFSSLGNHTVAESLGLIMAGQVFSESHVERDWLETGIGLLEQECEHQVLTDGGPAEQSFNYHRMVLDLYWLAVQFLEINGIHDCSGMKPRLLAGESFLQALGDPLPPIGDSDDGYAVAPRLYPSKPAPSADLPTAHKGCTVFPDTGMTVVHLPPNIRLTFDQGPLGMPPLYNHGHADALSITLYRSKRAFLIDPGTYRYNGNPVLRAYFKGTRVHNTVTIDGQDQARQVTSFIWDRPYSVQTSNENHSCGSIRLAASHDGYTRLNQPVHHIRLLFIPENGGGMVVQDKFPGKGMHMFELHYHLHPDVEVVGPNECGWYTLTNHEERIFIKVCQTKLKVTCGRTEPLLGWYSPAYGVLEKTHVLHGRFTGPAEKAQFTTLISFTNPDHFEELFKHAEYVG